MLEKPLKMMFHHGKKKPEHEALSTGTKQMHESLATN
jgi:hypothetical protein